MSPPPIKVTLGPYDLLEILRDEKDNLAKHLTAVECSIRDILLEVERQKHLQSLAPYYRTLQPPEGVARVQQMEELRASITEAIDAIERNFHQVEAEAAKASRTSAPARAVSGRSPSSENPRRRGF